MWFRQVSPKGPSGEDMVPSPLHYWEVVEPLAGGAYGEEVGPLMVSLGTLPSFPLSVLPGCHDVNSFLCHNILT